MSIGDKVILKIQKTQLVQSTTDNVIKGILIMYYCSFANLKLIIKWGNQWEATCYNPAATRLCPSFHQFSALRGPKFNQLENLNILIPL